MIEAEANRLATPNAATPRYGQCNRQALQLFELLACNVKPFSGGSSFAKENSPFDPCSAARAAIPLAPNGRDLIPPNQFGARIPKNPKSFFFDSFALQGL